LTGKSVPKVNTIAKNTNTEKRGKRRKAEKKILPQNQIDNKGNFIFMWIAKTD